MGFGRVFQAFCGCPARRVPILLSPRHKPPDVARWRNYASCPYRAVIFDMGGVLLPSPYKLAMDWEIRNCVPAGTIKEALRSGGEERPWMRFMRGQLKWAEFLQEFRQQCSRIVTDSFLLELTRIEMSDQLPAMTEAVKCIRARGLKAAVLTNNFYLESGESFLPIDRKQFDVIVESCREGVCKPDPRIYQLCLEHLGVLAKESIFLDDIGQNLKAASQLGIKTLKVDDADSAIQELETYLAFPLRCAVPYVSSVRPAMEIPTAPLQKYLENVLGAQVKGSLELQQFSHGQSNPTYYVRFGDHQLVLRKKPPGKLLPSAHAVEREYRVLKALRDTGIPVPKVLALCEDSRVIGTPFYLMEYSPGRIFKDPSLPELEPHQRTEVYSAMNSVLCQIHSVDIQTVGLEDYGKHGQASSATAESAGKLAEFMAGLAWDFATKEGFRIFRELPSPGAPIRTFGTWAGPRLLPTRGYATRSPASEPQLVLSPEGLPSRVLELHHKLKRFMDSHIYPSEQLLRDHQSSPSRWTPHSLVEELKEKAKSEGLWNLFLPLESDPEAKYGAGLTNVEFAHLSELMGTSVYAPEVFNCSAPDTGNMEVLVRYGTEAQKERWLVPLLEGRIRSCFAMTEPQVASSDATNIEASITREQDTYVLNGHKWWISGSLDPRCQLCLFMGKSNPEAQRHQQQSMLLVPMDTPGITVTRPLSVFGLEDAPAGHGQMTFENVRVPQENLLLGPGRGFEIAQGRLGPGRIHHCMRLIGLAERALALMKERVSTRVAFGKLLAEQGTIRADLAESRLEIEQARLLVLKAAHLMDTVGNKEAALEIALIKVVAPRVALRVVDRAIQAFGAAGLGSDLPLAQAFAWARVLRLADGPDEVHKAAIAKMELKRRLGLGGV
uniref:Acyl-CoA dehydrogenase family member 10 n=1 Tax=Pseudonaja textilis TaxID=8673 RepID=A0A670ZRS5_PSETE